MTDTTRGEYMVRSLRTAHSQHAIEVVDLRDTVSGVAEPRSTPRRRSVSDNYGSPSIRIAGAVPENGPTRPSAPQPSQSVMAARRSELSPTANITSNGSGNFRMRNLNRGVPRRRICTGLLWPCTAAVLLSAGLLGARLLLMSAFQPSALSATMTGPTHSQYVVDGGAGAEQGSRDVDASQVRGHSETEEGAQAEPEPEPGSHPWPNLAYIEQFNTPLAAFLSCTSLMYTLIFQYSYQTASSKLTVLSSRVADEASGISRLALTLRTLCTASPALESHLERLMEAVLWFNNIIVDEVVRGVTKLRAGPSEVLYRVIAEVREALAEGGLERNAYVDRALLGALVKAVDALSEARAARIVMSAQKIHIFTWVYLICLALCVFFGVLLLQTGSALLDGTLCGLSIFGFGVSLFILTDASRPYWGFLRVDLTPLVQGQLDLEALMVAHVDQHKPLGLDVKDSGSSLSVPPLGHGASAAAQAGVLGNSLEAVPKTANGRDGGALPAEPFSTLVEVAHGKDTLRD